MATEQAQQPPAATATRLQQPAAAIAASLPTETLAQILNSSLEGIDLWKRQKERMRFARVCLSWYSAVEVGRELVVKNTKVAERCAKSLMRGSAERRDRIRSLSINIEEDGVGRGQRVAELIRACPQLETLQLLGIGPRLGTSTSYLGKPLTEALKRLTKIRTLELASSDPFFISSTDLFSILSQWPNLSKLLLPSAHLGHYGLALEQPVEMMTTSLHELYLPLDSARCSSALTALLKSGQSTLRHLDFGSPGMTADEVAQVPSETTSLLETLAPQLVSLEAVFAFGSSIWRPPPYAPPTFLSSILQALRDVEEVALGDLGYSISGILPLLQPLPHLQVLSIGQSQLGAADGPFDQLTSQAAIDFLEGAAVLEYLSLPRQLQELWTKAELKRVKATAKECNVRFEMA